MKKFSAISIAILATLCFFSFNAHADGWSDGWTVVSCGIDDVDGMVIIVTDGNATYRFWAAADITNGALAVCLAAKANHELIDLPQWFNNKFTRIRYHTD